jgi:succinate dehydrogenase/fumarate reductase-like Fe-S protein
MLGYKDIVKAKLFRFNPDTDAAPRYETYLVPWQGSGNVLQLLKKIYEELDRTIAFRYYACGYQWCNTCMMTINGKPTHACFTRVKAGDEITLEPMKGYPIIRDLAVDFGKTVTTPEGSFEISKGAIIKQK